jgi:hypothetical protein
MKPTLKSELVTVEYWDCGNPYHRHKSEAVALECMLQMEKRALLKTGTRKWTDDELAKVLAAYRGGSRKCDLAKSLGLSQGRVGQIIERAKRVEADEDSVDSFDRLSERVRNCLRSEGLRTVEQVIQRERQGTLREITNLGSRSLHEIGLWLDMVAKRRSR